ncbi:MAG: VOC family protein [Chloroflexi bacterium]|nr:VOC family protein [Chloroflexota bacterium]
MLKIAVFGFYGPDQARITPPDTSDHVSPVSTDAFMWAVWEMLPPEARAHRPADAPCFVKLTRFAARPVYVQSVSDRMATGAGLLDCDGYIAIIDAVKILAPKTIQQALRRLYAQHPHADVIIAAGRQNEPDALSSDEIRAVLHLHPDLPIFPYTPYEHDTVHRLMRRMIGYIDNPDRVPPPIFVGQTSPAFAPANGANGQAPQPTPATATNPADQHIPPTPRIHGLDHVAITVRDLERALDFYRGLLGFRVLGTLDFPDDARGFTITYLDTGRGVLELFSFAPDEAQPTGWDADDRQTGMRHFALRVTNLDAVAEQLACADVPFTVQPMQATGGVRIAFFIDPDGTLIELIEGDLTYSRR